MLLDGLEKSAEPSKATVVTYNKGFSISAEIQQWIFCVGALLLNERFGWQRLFRSPCTERDGLCVLGARVFPGMLV